MWLLPELHVTEAGCIDKTQGKCYYASVEDEVEVNTGQPN